MPQFTRRIDVFACLAVMICTAGCGEPPPAVDDAPFRAAIVEYLQRNNMALAIKEIKRGPDIDGGSASLSASLTHEQLGGPSVTWIFQFSKRPDGGWRVTGHQD